MLTGTWEYTTDDLNQLTEFRRDDALILASEKNVEGYQRVAPFVDGNLYYWSSVNPDTNPDYPDIRVAGDGLGQPLVEREFVCNLGYQDYIYSMRADLIVYHRGFLKCMEHKTSVAGFVGQRLKSSQWDSQMTGQAWISSGCADSE